MRDVCVQGLSSLMKQYVAVSSPQISPPPGKGGKAKEGFAKKKKKSSLTENRTPVSRVTGGDTHHYTIEDP